jgi:hypothetical protein
MRREGNFSTSINPLAREINIYYYYKILLLCNIYNSTSLPASWIHGVVWNVAHMRIIYFVTIYAPEDGFV